MRLFVAEIEDDEDEADGLIGSSNGGMTENSGPMLVADPVAEPGPGPYAESILSYV